MASNESEGLHGIIRMTRKGKLMNPVELSRKVTGARNRPKAMEALRSQLDFAHSQGRTNWLAALAKELDSLQFHTRGWISDNVSRLAPARPRTTQDALSQPCRDIRLDSNPTLERVSVDMGNRRGASPASLLKDDDMDVDTDTEEKLLASSQPSSPEKSTASRSVPKPEAASSSKTLESSETRKSYSEAVSSTRSRDTSEDRRNQREVVKRQKIDRRDVEVGEKGKGCVVKGCEAKLSMFHAFSHHLPEVFHPVLSGEDVTCRRIGALKLASRWLLGQRASLSALVRYLDSTGSRRETIMPESQLVTAMEEFCSSLKIEIPQDLSVKRNGNEVTALLHWEVLMNLTSLLEDHQIEELRSLFALEEEERSRLPSLPVAFDSHCHLDRTMSHLGITTPSLEVILSALYPEEHYEVKVTRVVGVFCDPPSYPSPAQLQSWVDQGVVPVIGLHPTKSASEADLQTMEKLLSHSAVVGLGEVGLDHSLPPETWVDQMLRLRKVLTFLRPDHVLVLHTRSMFPVADEAMLSLMFQLQAHPNVKKEQLIHLHCFSATTVTLDLWLESFPNTYFGLTSMVEKFDPRKYPDQTNAAQTIHPDRLLLETDSPYFSPAGYRKSTPNLLGMTAASVGRLRGVPWMELLAQTNRNAERLYLLKQPPACI